MYTSEDGLANTDRQANDHAFGARPWQAACDRERGFTIHVEDGLVSDHASK